MCSLIIVKDKSAQTSRKIAYKTSGTFPSEKHVCLYCVLLSPKSALQPRGLKNILDKMGRFVLRKLEIYNFLCKQTLKPKATVYSSMLL